MGQQQLILLVLAVVIVGTAIVVGIRAFNENSVKANADAMMQDAVRIANDMQAWKQKPAPFGGQASVDSTAATTDPKDYSGATFPLLGYKADAGSNGLSYTNLNGTYTLTVTATEATVQGVNLVQNNEIQVVLDGISDTDINGTVECLGGSTPDGDACTAGQ